MNVSHEFGQTMRNDTFATWFGWSVTVAIIIFPMTTMVSTCHSNSMKESIEVAKIEAEHGNREATRTETMKWLVSRGTHPLVARCAILNSPGTQCANMMNALEDEDRSIIKELLANPFVEPASRKVTSMMMPTPVRTADDYVKGLDFGSRSPTR